MYNQQEWIYNFYFTKNVVTTTTCVGLKIAVKDEPIFFSRKGGFSQKRLRLRFWNLRQWISREKLYHNQLSPEDYKFLFPKHEFGYGVYFNYE